MDCYVFGYDSNMTIADSIGIDQSRDKSNKIHLIFCKHSDRKNLLGDITFLSSVLFSE